MAYSVSPGTPAARALLEDIEALQMPDYGDSPGGTKAPRGPRGVLLLAAESAIIGGDQGGGKGNRDAEEDIRPFHSKRLNNRLGGFRFEIVNLFVRPIGCRTRAPQAAMGSGVGTGERALVADAGMGRRELNGAEKR